MYLRLHSKRPFGEANIFYQKSNLAKSFLYITSVALSSGPRPCTILNVLVILLYKAAVTTLGYVYCILDSIQLSLYSVPCSLYTVQ